MAKKHYFDRQPIQNKTIAKDCERLFCKTYRDKLKFASAINSGGNKIYHVVKIGGKQTVIYLN